MKNIMILKSRIYYICIFTELFIKIDAINELQEVQEDLKQKGINLNKYYLFDCKINPQNNVCTSS